MGRVRQYGDQWRTEGGGQYEDQHYSLHFTLTGADPGILERQCVPHVNVKGVEKNGKFF